MYYKIIRISVITLGCLLVISISWLWVRSMDQDKAAYAIVIEEARREAFEAARYLSAELSEYDRSMITLETIDDLRFDYILIRSKYELTYPARIHARTTEGNYILVSYDGTMKQELEMGSVWNKSTENETRQKYKSALYHYDEAEKAWSSGEAVEQFEILEDVSYPNHSLFFPLQDTHGTFLLLEIIPDYSRLFYQKEVALKSRNGILLTALISILLFGMPLVEHFLYGTYQASLDKPGNWIPSWLRVIQGDIMANYVFYGVVLIYPAFIYGLVFFDMDEAEDMVLRVFLVSIWLLPFLIFFVRGLIIRRLFVIGKEVNCKLQGQQEVLLGYGHAMQGIKEWVGVFVYEYHGEEYSLQVKKTKRLIAEVKGDDFKPVALVHPAKPRRAVLRNNFI